MKSFGVRLAAGALTILFGAYAAAIAQKDKDSGTDNWTAEAPELGQPAAPIADIGEQTWISEPDPSPSDPVESSVQLVQHTEATPQSNDAQGPQSSLGLATLPSDFDANAAEADSDYAPDVAFSPDSVTMSDDAPAPDWSTDLPEPMAGDSSATMTLPTQNDSGLPESEIGQGPAIDFAGSEMPGYPSDAPASAALGQPASADLGQPATAYDQPTSDAGDPIAPEASGQANVLRGNPTDTNLLRSAPDAAEGDSGYGDTGYGDAGYDDAGYGGGSYGGAGSVSADETPMQTWEQENQQPNAGFGGAPQPFAVEPQGSQLPGSSPDAESYPSQPYQGDGYPQPSYGESSVAMTGSPAAPLMPMNGQRSNQPVDYQQPARSVAINPELATGEPGERRLEGAQTPSIVIQKRAPSEVKVGQVATFAIHVQNVGSVEALDVRVQDMIPSGMELVDASPRPVQEGKLLLWQLGSMPAGDEQTISLQLVPRQEGELGSVARVSFEAEASVRTIATRPELKIVQIAPETVLIGQQLEIELEVSNPGTGEAVNVVLQEDVPPGLEHPKGRQLDNALGNLAPGEIRRQVLRMKAVAPGIVSNTIRLTGDDGLVSEHTVQVQVVAPELRVELEGPSRRFLERQATYYVHVGNVGTADAHNVEMSVQLDRGFTFVSTENQGQYDPSRHSVHWSVAQMPAGESGKVALTLLPVQEGEQAITLNARADLGIVAKNERRLSVEGFSELSFSISNPGGPIELGSETTYEIKVSNSGSKADSNIRVALQLPAGLELISAQGDAGTDGRGRVEFQPKATLAPGTEHGYKIRVRGVVPGTHIVKAVVVSDLATTPVTKEESTVVYADR